MNRRIIVSIFMIQVSSISFFQDLFGTTLDQIMSGIFRVLAWFGGNLYFGSKVPVFAVDVAALRCL